MKKNIIKNLVVNNITLYSIACYGAAVLVPIVAMKGIDSDFPYVGKEKETYPDSITVVDGWEEEEVNGEPIYSQASRTYEISEDYQYLLDYAEYDIDKLEKLLGEPVLFSNRFSTEISDAEKKEGKKVYLSDEKYATENKSNKQKALDKLGKLLIYIALTGFTCSVASILIEEKGKTLTK